MATPVVSGAAALLIQKSPSLTPDQVKARLMKTATKSFSLYTSAPGHRPPYQLQQHLGHIYDRLRAR